MPHVGRAGWSPISPFFYGGSREHGLIVLEDLGDGDGPNTAEALGGNDLALAEQLLIEHAALIGQLHGATIGRFEEYRRLRSALGPEPINQKIYQDPWSDARLRPITRSEIDDAININHRLPDAIKSDRQRGPTTLRQQVVAWIEDFAELSEERRTWSDASIREIGSCDVEASACFMADRVAQSAILSSIP